MRGFRMTEIQWHWCFSLGEYRDGKRSLDRRGTKSRRRRGFDKCQRSLRGGRVLPQLREGPTRHPWVVRTVRDPLSPSAVFGQHGRSQGISCRRGRRGITGENDPKLTFCVAGEPLADQPEQAGRIAPWSEDSASAVCPFLLSCSSIKGFVIITSRVGQILAWLGISTSQLHNGSDAVHIQLCLLRESISRIEQNVI